MTSTLEQVVSGNLNVVDTTTNTIFYSAGMPTGAPLPGLEATATPTPEATYTPEPTATQGHRHVRATKTASPTETYTPEATPTATITPTRVSQASSIAVSPPKTGDGGYLPQNHGGNGIETAVLLSALAAGIVANAVYRLYHHAIQK